MIAEGRGLLVRLVERARRRSAWLFHLNAGACNGCDIELVACLSPRYDVEQLGIRLEGSPRHADVLCVSGPVTLATREALETIHAQLPEPKVVVAIGSCAATCNVFAGSPMVAGPVDRIVPVDVYVPGCPPRPHAIIDGIAQALSRLAGGRPAAPRRAGGEGRSCEQAAPPSASPQRVGRRAVNERGACGGAAVDEHAERSEVPR